MKKTVKRIMIWTLVIIAVIAAADYVSQILNVVGLLLQDIKRMIVGWIW